MLYQLSLADGSVKKEVGLRAPVPMSSPRLADRDVYVGGTRSLSSYSLDKQALNWRSKSPATFGMGNIPVALNDQAAFTSGITFYGLWRAFRALPFSQFWTMDPKKFLQNPVYTRDYPPMKG